MRTHGKRSTYAGGCRCAACTEANTDFKRRLRERRNVPPPPDDTWRDEAACVGMGADWHQLVERSPNQAKAVCAGCPVKTECLGDAIATREVYGIRGGETMGLIHKRGDASRVPCAHCGELFLRTETGPIKYCSKDCYRVARAIADARNPRAQRGSTKKACIWCGDPVHGGEYHAEGFCGWPCRRAHQRARTQELIG